MEALKKARTTMPQRIQVDNGSEFISKDFDKWAYDNKVILDYSRPGKPTDNAFIESFNASFRDECLNMHWFLSLDDAYEKITAWAEEYNHYRPHSSLKEMTPAAFIDYCELNDMKTQTLPGAPLPEAMYFAATDYRPALPENTYLQEENLTVQNSPKSPT